MAMFVPLLLLLVLPTSCCAFSVIVPSSSTSSLLLAHDTPAALSEPTDSNFGRKDYWNEFYADSSKDDSTATTPFSWYSEWHDLAPFVQELIPDFSASILIPGVGNDSMLRDMYDAGYQQLTAFDYAEIGVLCAMKLLQDRPVKVIVADARDLIAFADDEFHAILEKGTLDAIYLSGGKNKTVGATNLQMAVSELARVTKPGGIVISLTAACVDAVSAALEKELLGRGCWTCVRDGSFYMTEEDGYASNNIDGTFLAWRRNE
jgi:SAM-dependent methyltransferase